MLQDPLVQTTQGCGGEAGSGSASGQLYARMRLGSEQFILSAVWGMISDQRLEHFTKPRGKPLGSNTLGRGASAFSETLVISELGIVTQANEPLAKFNFILTDDTARRMILVRQLDGSVGKSTAVLGLVHPEVTDIAQSGEEPGLSDHPRGRRQSYPRRDRKHFCRRWRAGLVG